LRNDVTMDGVERDGTRRPSGIAARSSPLGVVPLARVDRDRVLVEALRRREPTAAERLITAYAAPAYRLAVRITGSAPDAEDVVQEAFWSVVRKIDTFRGDSAFGSWLYRIVANGAYGKLRREHARRSNRSLDEIRSTFDEHDGHREVVADWTPRIVGPSIQIELQLVLTAALDALPGKHRAAIMMRDVHGLSYRELGEALGISVTSAKSRVHRARLSLRKSVGGVHVLSERRARSRGVRPEAGSARPALRGRVLTPAWRGPRTSVTGGMPRSQLRRVEEYVQANLAGDLRLTKLSTLVHMSPYHFARLFKQGAGVTPRQFVIRRRIEAAKILLTAQHRPIGDVALQVGFTSQSYFTTTFRRVTGVTPGHYRPQGAGSAESAHHVMKPPEKSA
jgi:RNA polymerase sigma-70 factor, ECF subfamily